MVVFDNERQEHTLRTLTRVESRNNALKELTGKFWTSKIETIVATYVTVHLFKCAYPPTDLLPIDMWFRPSDVTFITQSTLHIFNFLFRYAWT